MPSKIKPQKELSTSFDPSVRVRVDKWLWAARFFKTRSMAARAIEAGHVRLNSERAKSANEVHIDDVIHIVAGTRQWEVRVRIVSDTRSSAGIAQTLFAETERSMLAREAAAEHRALFREPALGARGRPTKRDRRQIDRFRGED